MSDDVTCEYAIEVPGQGWLLGMMPGTYSLVPDPQIFSGQLDDAREALRRARNFYSRIGAAVVGDQLRLVVRTVSVVRSDWADA